MGGAKLPQRLKNAGLQQREQIVELDQVVLHRCGRQKKQKPLVQAVDEPIGLAGTIAQMMRFIDNDKIVSAGFEMPHMLCAARERQRGNHEGLSPEPFRIPAQKFILRRGAADAELGLEFLAPLADKRRRHENERPLHHAAQDIFLQHHTCFDGLAEAHFVGQQHATAKLFEHLAHRLGLVPEGLDLVQMGMAQEFVEALRQTEMRIALPQAEPALVFARGRQYRRAQRPNVDVEDYGDVNVDTWQPGNRRCGIRRYCD